MICACEGWIGENWVIQWYIMRFEKKMIMIIRFYFKINNNINIRKKLKECIWNVNEMQVRVK